MVIRTIRRMTSSRGQTLIEFAFVAPLMLVFLLAIVDFGIALDRRIVLDHGVREGVRFASVGGHAGTTGVPATEQDIRNHTEAQSQGIADASGTEHNYIEVCYEDANGSGTLGDIGDNVEVRVHYRHDFVTGFTAIINSTLANIDLNPRSSARLELRVGSPVLACGPWPPT